MDLQRLNELDFGNIGQWPKVAKAILILILCGAVGGAMYYFLTKDILAKLEREKAHESELKVQFEMKAKLASNLPIYKQQMEQMQEMFQDLLKQLPSQTEIAGLLDDITYIGVDNGLEFKKINWQPEVKRNYAVEVPMSIEVIGTYDQLGKFSADVAALPRIVMLEDFQITRVDGSEDKLFMKVLAKTFRYEDQVDAGGKK